MSENSATRGEVALVEGKCDTRHQAYNEKLNAHGSIISNKLGTLKTRGTIETRLDHEEKRNDDQDDRHNIHSKRIGTLEQAFARGSGKVAGFAAAAAGLASFIATMIALLAFMVLNQ